MPNAGSTKPLSRSEIQRHLADIAGLYGWLYHRSSPSLTLDGYADGFPAGVLVRQGRLLFVALSGERLTPPELAWAEQLAGVSSVQLHTVRRDDLSALTEALRPEGRS